MLGGTGRERLVHAPSEGVWHTPFDIGAVVSRGQPLGNLAEFTIVAPLSGVLRGVARDCAFVPAGVKLIEIDPRGRRAKWTGLDSRSRAIGEATLHAIREAQKRRKRAPRFAQIPH